MVVLCEPELLLFFVEIQLIIDALILIEVIILSACDEAVVIPA